MADSLAEAAARLEAAVDRLAAAAARPRPAGIPPERLADLSRRLDRTLTRLRLALGEAEDDLPEDEREDRGA